MNKILSQERQRDQFYTSNKCVNHVLSTTFQFLRTRGIKISKNNNFIEPSAGKGAFINWLSNKGYKVTGYDLEPKLPSILQKDFFELNLKYDNKNIVIGNPPFGYKAKLAIDFINKSLDFSDIVIFILPIQFRRWLTQKQVREDAKLLFELPKLEQNSFIYKDKPYNVNCLVQVWVKDIKKFEKFENLRVLNRPAGKHDHFKTWIHNNTPQTLKYFNKRTYKWDIAIVRQGYYDYSKIITDPKKLIKNRQYLFVKFLSPFAREIFKKINFIELSNSNTSIKGFSNTDLVAQYETIYNKEYID